MSGFDVGEFESTEKIHNAKNAFCLGSWVYFILLFRNIEVRTFKLQCQINIIYVHVKLLGWGAGEFEVVYVALLKFGIKRTRCRLRIKDSWERLKVPTLKSDLLLSLLRTWMTVSNWMLRQDVQLSCTAGSFVGNCCLHFRSILGRMKTPKEYSHLLWHYTSDRSYDEVAMNWIYKIQDVC